MTDPDEKNRGAGSTMEVSEQEVEAYLGSVEPSVSAVGTDTAPVVVDVQDPSSAPPSRPSGPAPPPLPSRKKRWRPHPVQIIGFALLCTVLGLGIGFLWSLIQQPKDEQASADERPRPAAAADGEETTAPAGVQIRLDELVVTSGDEADESNGEED